MSIALIPLSRTLHVGALQHLYRATPGYWALYHYLQAPPGQAANDMKAAEATAGRYLMGVVQPRTPTQDAEAPAPNGAGELIGLIDFRLDWPEAGTVYIGMIMIAEAYQRQGIGTAAWQLLQPWLAASAKMSKARLAVEQFNPKALQFFQHLGFQLTGEANRFQVGERLVRLLYMEYDLSFQASLLLGREDGS
jgi:RimJ/RimL family protein N-acetyltransferase